MGTRPRQRDILAIDWDSRTLRIVHARYTKRGVDIDRLLSVPIPADVDPAQPAQMGGHIRRALDQEGITTRHAVVDIPRDQAILNTLTLPALVPEELPGIVRIQIAKELPYSVSDAVIDFTIGPQEPGSALAEVLVAAVRREVLEQYEATFAAADLKLDRIGLRPYASKVAVCELLRHAMPERVVFLDVGPALTEICVLRHSFLAFSRAASVHIPRHIGEGATLSLVRPEDPEAFHDPEPVSDITPPAVAMANVIQSLVVELTRSLEAYRAREAGAPIDHVIIGGDLGVEERLAEAIQKRLSITTEIYNPASSFGWEPDEGAAASAFAATLGLVLTQLREDGGHFDFLHPKRVESVAKKRLRKAPIVASVGLLFVAAAVVAVAGVTRPSREELARILSQIETLRAEESDQRKFLELVNGPGGIAEFDEQQHIWVDVLHDAMSVLPSHENLVCDQIDLNQKDDRITLRTRARQRSVPLDAIRQLEDFRREGRERPRFKASMGPQNEKPGEKYPFQQDLRIQILDDGLTKASRDRAAEGG